MIIFPLLVLVTAVWGDGFNNDGFNSRCPSNNKYYRYWKICDEPACQQKPYYCGQDGKCADQQGATLTYRKNGKTKNLCYPKDKVCADLYSMSGLWSDSLQSEIGTYNGVTLDDELYFRKHCLNGGECKGFEYDYDYDYKENKKRERDNIQRLIGQGIEQGVCECINGFTGEKCEIPPSQPTAAPTTEEPAEAPTKAVATEAPTKAVATEAPTTKKPTKAPMTEEPKEPTATEESTTEGLANDEFNSRCPSNNKYYRYWKICDEPKCQQKPSFCGQDGKCAPTKGATLTYRKNGKTKYLCYPKEKVCADVYSMTNLWSSSLKSEIGTYNGVTLDDDLYFRKNCLNGGECKEVEYDYNYDYKENKKRERDILQGVCECKNGFTGDKCEFPPSELTSAPLIGKPAKIPATAKPTEAPTTEERSEATSRAESTAAPKTAESTAAPITAEPTTAPDAEPTAAPETAEPTAAPQTSDSTAAPETAEPTAAPQTAERTAAPQTAEPTAAPSTAEPTAAPQTAEPTAAPTTAKPTVAPTIAEPSAPPSSAGPTATPIATQKPTSKVIEKLCSEAELQVKNCSNYVDENGKLKQYLCPFVDCRECLPCEERKTEKYQSGKFKDCIKNEECTNKHILQLKKKCDSHCEKQIVVAGEGEEKGCQKYACVGNQDVCPERPTEPLKECHFWDEITNNTKDGRCSHCTYFVQKKKEIVRPTCRDNECEVPEPEETSTQCIYSCKVAEEVGDCDECHDKTLGRPRLFDNGTCISQVECTKRACEPKNCEFKDYSYAVQQVPIDCNCKAGETLSMVRKKCGCFGIQCSESLECTETVAVCKSYEKEEWHQCSQRLPQCIRKLCTNGKEKCCTCEQYETCPEGKRESYGECPVPAESCDNGDECCKKLCKKVNGKWQKPICVWDCEVCPPKRETCNSDLECCPGCWDARNSDKCPSDWSQEKKQTCRCKGSRTVHGGEMFKMKYLKDKN